MTANENLILSLNERGCMLIFFRNYAEEQQISKINLLKSEASCCIYLSINHFSKKINRNATTVKHTKSPSISSTSYERYL